MKKFLCCLLIISLLFITSACSQQHDDTTLQPDITRMRAICELATLECYYHNVAKFKETEKKLWWEETKHFWIEYEGVVKIGIDASLVNIDISDNDIVTITIPPAKIINTSVTSESLNSDSFIRDSTSAKITAEDETKAMAQAKAKMEEAAQSNRSLLSDAQERAKKLLNDYIVNIGNCIGKTYKINWVYVDESGKAIDEPTIQQTTDNQSQ